MFQVIQKELYITVNQWLSNHLMVTPRDLSVITQKLENTAVRDEDPIQVLVRTFEKHVDVLASEWFLGLE